LPQFLIIFGASLPALIGVILLGWRLAMPHWPTFGWVTLAVLGIPIAFLALATSLSSTVWGQAQMGGMELPEEVNSYAEAIIQRWLSEPWTLILVGVLLALVLTALITILLQAKTRWAGSVDLVFVLLLAGIGLALVYAPEFVFLRDYFGTRMNTVFKFYYQGWLLLGLASAYLITVALSRLPKKVGVVEALAAVSLLLILSCVLFPFAGVYAKTGGFALAEPTLDSTAYVARGNPDVMAAVEWVHENTTPDERVLEAKGGSYNADQNRISAMTGRATLLGWDGHESQWRGKAYGTMAQGRSEAIEQVYRTASPQEIPAILDEWGIDYVYVGPVETDLYGITHFRLDEIGAALDTVFSQGQVHIFRRRQD
jgi:uncharacterized membrane protein